METLASPTLRWVPPLHSNDAVCEGEIQVVKELLALGRMSSLPDFQDGELDKARQWLTQNKLGEKKHQEITVRTRFPPEPSGYLHIGHVKAVLVNQKIAMDHKGEMILRFDDTNPGTENEEYERSILDDLQSLGIQFTRVSHTSDYFAKFVEFAEVLIRKHLAYVDENRPDQVKAERKKSQESNCRNRTVEENLDQWERMKIGEIKQAVLRAKIDMKNKNGCMRDPTLYRSCATQHYRTGRTWKVYPTYDFSCPIIDSLEGITHVFRSSEYQDRDEQYKWVLTQLALTPPIELGNYGKLKFVNTPLSKRILKSMVMEGRVSGWDDPRLPTVRGILRRGMNPEALQRFMHMQGGSRNEIKMTWDKIWAINRMQLEPRVERFLAVKQEDAKAYWLDETEIFVELDSRDGPLKTPQEEVTLIQYGNAVLGISGTTAQPHKEGSVKSTQKKLNWVHKSSCIPGILVIFPSQDSKTWLDDPIIRRKFWGEDQMRNIMKGQVVQLMRHGLFRCEASYEAMGQHLVLFQIPDGSQRMCK